MREETKTLFPIKSQERSFRVVDDIGRSVDIRANGVNIVDGALVFVDLRRDDPSRVVAAGRWQSVVPQ